MIVGGRQEEQWWTVVVAEDKVGVSSGLRRQTRAVCYLSEAPTQIEAQNMGAV